MRRTTLLLTAAVLFATVSLSLAQSPTPAASPAPSASPARSHRQRKATPAPAASPMASPMAAASPAMTPAMTPAMGASPAPMKKSRTRKSDEGAAEGPVNATPAPGGGPGMVWVNTKSHKYHMEGSRYYGKTKEGKYLSEKDAIAEGDKPVGNPKSDAPAKTQ